MLLPHVQSLYVYILGERGWVSLLVSTICDGKPDLETELSELRAWCFIGGLAWWKRPCGSTAGCGYTVFIHLSGFGTVKSEMYLLWGYIK